VNEGGKDEGAVHAVREESFLLAAPEKRFLRWVAAKLPKRILPDDLTALGVLSAVAIMVAYLILSINVYLESFAFNRFSIGYGKIGPTEIRLILIALNTGLALRLGLDVHLVGLNLTVFDVVGLGIAGTMVVLLAGRSFRNLRELAKKEPAAPRR
jgi:hypothetical protein